MHSLAMKPVLILQLRPEDDASHGEYEAFLKHGGLSAEQTVRVRMERDGLGTIDLDEYAGVIVGGGPHNVSDPVGKKPPEQKEYEPALYELLQEIVERDHPYLGACYGIGALSCALGGEVSKEKYGEEVGGVTITLTEDGVQDPLLQGLPHEFRAFCGHKEACQDVPAGAVLLASSATCPVQMLRFATNVYATQFHPELDADGIAVRINIYKHAGYFPPEDAEALIADTKQENITVPMQILKRFVARALHSQ